MPESRFQYVNAEMFVNFIFPNRVKNVFATLKIHDLHQ